MSDNDSKMTKNEGGLVERLRTLSGKSSSNGFCVAIAEAADRIEALEKECFALAANQCHAGYGDEYGNHRCARIEALETALREIAGYQPSSARQSAIRIARVALDKDDRDKDMAHPELIVRAAMDENIKLRAHIDALEATLREIEWLRNMSLDKAI